MGTPIEKVLLGADDFKEGVDKIVLALHRVSASNGGEVEITDDIKLDALEYTGDLGGRTIHAFIGGGDKMLVLGMNNGTALQTNNPCGTYKRLLADFEKEIIEWRNSHSGCAKPITEVAQA